MSIPPPSPPKPNPAQVLRSRIYESPLAEFGPGWPTECQVVQNWMFCVDKFKADNNCQRINNKKPIYDMVIENILANWKSQPDPKVIADKDVDISAYNTDRRKLLNKVQSLVKSYDELKGMGWRLNHRDCDEFINGRKNQLQTRFNVDLKSEQQCKKRPIEEVSNHCS